MHSLLFTSTKHNFTLLTSAISSLSIYLTSLLIQKQSKVDDHKKDADLQVLANFFKTYNGTDSEKKTVMDQVFKDLSRLLVDRGEGAQVDDVLSIVNVCIFMAKKGFDWLIFEYMWLYGEIWYKLV